MPTDSYQYNIELFFKNITLKEMNDDFHALGFFLEQKRTFISPRQPKEFQVIEEDYQKHGYKEVKVVVINNILKFKVEYLNKEQGKALKEFEVKFKNENHHNDDISVQVLSTPTPIRKYLKELAVAEIKYIDIADGEVTIEIDFIHP